MTYGAVKVHTPYMTKTAATPMFDGEESPCEHCRFPVEANIGQAGGSFAYVHSMTGQVLCEDEQKALKDAFPVKANGRDHAPSMNLIHQTRKDWTKRV